MNYTNIGLGLLDQILLSYRTFRILIIGPVNDKNYCCQILDSKLYQISHILIKCTYEYKMYNASSLSLDMVGENRPTSVFDVALMGFDPSTS